MDRIAFIRSKLSRPTPSTNLPEARGVFAAANPEEAALAKRIVIPHLITHLAKPRPGPKMRFADQFADYNRYKWFKETAARRKKQLGHRNRKGVPVLAKIAHAKQMKLSRVPPWQENKKS